MKISENDQKDINRHYLLITNGTAGAVRSSTSSSNSIKRRAFKEEKGAEVATLKRKKDISTVHVIIFFDTKFHDGIVYGNSLSPQDQRADVNFALPIDWNEPTIISYRDLLNIAKNASKESNKIKNFNEQEDELFAVDTKMGLVVNPETTRGAKKLTHYVQESGRALNDQYSITIRNRDEDSTFEVSIESALSAAANVTDIEKPKKVNLLYLVHANGQLDSKGGKATGVGYNAMSKLTKQSAINSLRLEIDNDFVANKQKHAVIPSEAYLRMPSNRDKRETVLSNFLEKVYALSHETLGDNITTLNSNDLIKELKTRIKGMNTQAVVDLLPKPDFSESSNNISHSSFQNSINTSSAVEASSLAHERQMLKIEQQLFLQQQAQYQQNQQFLQFQQETQKTEVMLTQSLQSLVGKLTELKEAVNKVAAKME